MLMSSEYQDCNVISVVTIVGTGGLGKTTLAQFAYGNKKVRQKLDEFGWICVSEDFNVERLTREAVEVLTKNKRDIKNLSVLEERVRGEVSGKKVLLILDDVWNEKRSLWESFCTPFMSAKLVEVLVTMRN